MASISDEYEKLQRLGSGSFATIWKVRHKSLRYVRALKVSKEEVSSETEHAYQQFLKECTVLLKIGNGCHPNIVRIYQPRLLDGRASVEMDYVKGQTLNGYLQKVKFIEMDEFYRLFEQIVGALAYCHHDIYEFLMDPNVDNLTSDPDDGSRYLVDEETERRLVAKYAVTHNDIHSNNVMRRDYDGSFVLLDFGLAIQDGQAVKTSARTGGALEYMAPEKFEKSGNISTQSDIYSLGILLYEALAGRVPFVLTQGASILDQTAMYQQHKTGIPPSIEALRREAFEAANPGQTYQKDFPDRLEEMILHCIEKNPADRYQNAKQLYDDFKSKMETNAITDNVALLKENTALKRKLHQADEQAEELQNVIDSKNHAITDMRNMVGNLQDDVAKLDAENKDLQNTCSNLVQQNNALSAENDKLKENAGKTKGGKEWKVLVLLFAVASVVLGFLYYKQYTALKTANITVENMETDDGWWTGQATPDSVANGYGELRYRDDDPDGRISYNGSMADGKREGHGVLVYKNGNSFDGTFQDDNCVQGTFKAPSLNLYFEGEFKDNKPFEGLWKQFTDNKVMVKVANGKKTQQQ
jgi:serine/threonine protein kinase